MAYSFRHTNPELAGVLVKEKVRCNRPNCRCMKRSELHGWYYYLYWRDYRYGCILRKKYVSKARVRELVQKIKLAKEYDIREKLNFKKITNPFNLK